MPIIKLQGLRGLPGLNRLSEKDRENFYAANSDILNSKNFKSLTAMDKAADILYNNKQFVNKFGQKVFDQYNDGTENSYNLRNNLLKNSIIEDTWKQYTSAFSPFNDKGLARSNNTPHWNTTDWAKYNDMSPDAKLKLMESDWLSPKELEDKWKDVDEVDRRIASTRYVPSGAGATLGAQAFAIQTLNRFGLLNSQNDNDGILKNIAKGLESTDTEAAKQFYKERNNKILENIYNDDLKDRTNALGSAVSQTYLSDPSIANLSDDQVKKAFYNNFVSDNSDMVKLGAGEFASHWGSSELKDFSIDDMRQALAKKKVYMQNMSPVAASTALNNEAKDYIKDHQGSLKRAGLFLKDVGISALSYTADKINGIWEPVRWAEDGISGKPTVWVDDTGNIIDSKKTRLIQSKADPSLHFYYDKDNKVHYVRPEQLNRSTLHQMGKNYDGSDDEGILNPQYWSRAEQFGTLDSDEQKQYEKLGSSPYKVAYDPNEDTDLWYEAFKMSSFGIADAASQLIPFGIGMAGRALSTASKVGKVARGFGKAIDTVGKGLTAQSRVGQVIQGTAGATGIAYAYGRGAFQETLAQNMANAEETINNKARNQIYNEYNTNKSFKRLVDMRVDERAAKLKQQYLKQVQRDGGMKIADMKAVDKLVHSQAQEEYLNDLVTNRVSDLKRGKDWADLQQEAISSAGNTAIATYLPEAVKYGLVNNLGFRKYLYTNPSGVAKKVSSSLKGLKEITTEGGKQRLATEASKFLTRGDKWKQLGKTALSQAWGGAWTNGTDDMMTDAAERINNDSFDRYLNGYYTGQAIADTYGFADGLYSYLKGFSNSLGQETTMNSTLVGGLGSLVSFSPNFANMAHLATKEGREAYRNQFQQRYLRNDDGTIQRNEDGSPKIEKISPRENWRERANFFIQNGVLNTYYGKKQSERDLQNHADYVNGILDDYNDFDDITNLVASDRAIDEAANDGDKKTARFIKALHAVNTLNNLANSDKDPATMSSVVQNAKSLIDNLSEMDFDPEKDNIPNDESVNSLIAQYYASNPSMAQNSYNDRVALSTMIKNAKELQSATDAYNKAEEEIQKAERNYGEPFAIPVREKLKLNQALDGHWRNRLESMKNELNDTSTEGEVSDEDILSSLGGKKNAETLVRAYNRQEKELTDALNDQQKQVDETKKKYDESQKDLDDNTDDNQTYDLQKKLDDARAKYEDALLQKGYIQEQIATTKSKREKVSNAITEANKEGVTEKKVLTADEIFNLDPITRARMMNKDNRNLYSQEQKNEIEKLEHRLTMQDADALQKLQDISTLTQRIEANSDAYNRIMQNPEAAAVRFEAQKSQAAIAAYNFVNQRNAQIAADYMMQMDEALSPHKDVSQQDKENFVYKQLRKLNVPLLSTIEEEHLLPKYQKQVTDAKEWANVVGDLNSVITNSEKDEDWKNNVRQNINNIVETANTKDEIIANIEKAIDDIDNPQAKQDLDTILQGMTNLGYQRDATILENRKKRKEREEVERKKAEERKQKIDEDAQIAAAEKAAKEAEEDNAKTDHPIAFDGSDAIPTMEAPEHTPEEPNTEEVGKPEEVPLTWANALIDNDAEEGSVDAGNMWHGSKDSAKKDTFHVTLKKHGMTEEKVITFSSGDTVENLSIAPNEWTTDNSDATGATKDDLSKAGITKDTPFIAKSMYNVNGNWYFDGNFDGHEEDYRVKASDKFNLDRAIDRQRTAREAELAAQGVDTGNPNVTVVDDNVVITTESLEQQADETKNMGKEQHISDNTTDLSSENTIGESNIENNEVTLSGNAMSEYVPQKLVEDGILEHKKGENPNDAMNRFYKWMDNAGIHLQNIIDDELAGILQQNPHAKVKFMAVRGDNNATDDNAMQNHLMLVLDYDDSINKGITSIHDNEKNGGVIKSDGKQYLIIGVAGYNRDNTAKRDLYDILYSNNPHGTNGYGIVRKAKGKFFREHPDERYYVDQTIETEVVPNSLIPGYIVRQLEGDSNPEFRSITEILADDKRNPYGFDINSLSWGIQELSQYLIVGRPIGSVMIPRNTLRNLGNAFVLIPASNGKMIPAYLKPLFYNEMKDGVLKDRVKELLNNVLALDYQTRYQAVMELSRIFYLNNKDGDGILLRQSRAELSLVHGGEVFKTFVLDSNFDRQAFFDAMADMNPRVNITSRVLQDTNLLKEWDEAGALDTDVAKLGTSGSSYSIYGLDANGNMLQKETPSNTTKETTTSTDYRNTNRQQIILQHKYYTMSDGKYYLNGIPVTDEATIEQLDYNRKVIEGNFEPAGWRGVWDYYIMSSGDNPDVVRINKNTKEVVKLSQDEAKSFIDKLAKEAEEKRRKEEAEKALQSPVNTEDVDLEGDNNSEHPAWIDYFSDLDDKKSATQRVIDKAKEQLNLDTSEMGDRNHTAKLGSLLNGVEISLNDNEYKQQQRLFARFNAGQVTTQQLNSELKVLASKVRQRVINEFNNGDYHSLVDSPEIRSAKQGYENRNKTSEDTLDRSNFTQPFSPINNKDFFASQHDSEGASLLVDDNGNFIPKATDIDNFRSIPALRRFFDFKDSEVSLKEATGFIILSSGKLSATDNSDIKMVDKKGVIKLLGPNSPSNTTPIRPTVKATSATQTFVELHKQPKYMFKLSKLIRSKWKDAPKDSKGLMEFLRGKNIEVDAIGTSQEDIDAWMKTIKDCR